MLLTRSFHAVKPGLGAGTCFPRFPRGCLTAVALAPEAPGILERVSAKGPTGTLDPRGICKSPHLGFLVGKMGLIIVLPCAREHERTELRYLKVSGVRMLHPDAGAGSAWVPGAGRAGAWGLGPSSVPAAPLCSHTPASAAGRPPGGQSQAPGLGLWSLHTLGQGRPSWASFHCTQASGCCSVTTASPPAGWPRFPNALHAAGLPAWGVCAQTACRSLLLAPCVACPQTQTRALSPL